MQIEMQKKEDQQAAFDSYVRQTASATAGTSSSFNFSG
jgi:hypothetical protein